MEIKQANKYKKSPHPSAGVRLRMTEHIGFVAFSCGWTFPLDATVSVLNLSAFYEPFSLFSGCRQIQYNHSEEFKAQRRIFQKASCLCFSGFVDFSAVPNADNKYQHFVILYFCNYSVIAYAVSPLSGAIGRQGLTLYSRILAAFDVLPYPSDD